MTNANPTPEALRERLRNRTWYPAGSSLEWDDAKGEYVTRRGVRPPPWLGSAELVANLHLLRRTFGHQALTVAVFRRAERGERAPRLWAVMAVGDPKAPGWVEALVGEEGR